MTRSMTGFARHESNFSWGQVTWEIRSVNHRYLEPHFRLPEKLRSLEPNLRDALRNSLSRGKIEVNLQLQTNQLSQTLAIDSQLLVELANAAQTVSQTLENSGPVNPLEALRWPGVIQESQLDFEQIQIDALTAFKTALDKLIDQRGREGNELAQLIETRLQTIEELVAQLRTQIPAILTSQKQKIIDRIEALEVEIDQNRLEQELVYLAQKSDVDEELDRLITHVGETRHCLKQKKSIGRRLDFLMQEFNREANTLGSKSSASDTTKIAIELKVLIEQMREQVQNIE